MEFKRLSALDIITIMHGNLERLTPAILCLASSSKCLVINSNEITGKIYLC